MNKNKSFSILELMVVLIIVGLLAVLGLPQIRTAREDALDKEAHANLKLIQAAEQYAFMKGAYSACNNRNQINSRLLLDIPTSTNWDYKVDSVSATNFTARARRSLAPRRVWCVQRDTITPYSCAW